MTIYVTISNILLINKEHTKQNIRYDYENLILPMILDEYIQHTYSRNL